jgi:hypothetical protein
VDSVEECPANNKPLNKKNKSIQLNIMNGLVLIKKQLHKKLEKLSEKKLSSNILIKEVIQINSKKLLMLTKY